VLHNELIGQTYNGLYCLAPGLKYKSCKRYIVSEDYGKKAPSNIMPNSTLSIAEIVSRST